MRLIILLITSAYFPPIYGQLPLIYDDTISQQMAIKHIKEGKFYYLTYGEFASIPFQRCEKEIWDKYSCEVVHVSNFSVPEANLYNEVLFKYLYSAYGIKWQLEKDSLLENCLTNNVCGINTKEWNFSNYQFPDLLFEENSYELSELTKCLLSNFYIPILNDFQINDDYSIRVSSIVEKNETTDNLAHKRCNSVILYLVEKGIKKERLIIGGEKEGIFSDYKFDDYEKFKKWNRVVFLQID